MGYRRIGPTPLNGNMKLDPSSIPWLCSNNKALNVACIIVSYLENKAQYPPEQLVAL